MEYSARCKIPAKIGLVDVIRFVEKADLYHCNIIIEANHISINAKSLLSMCMLASGLIKGTATIRTSGQDARKALEDMKWLFSQEKGLPRQTGASEATNALADVELYSVESKEQWVTSPPDI